MNPLRVFFAMFGTSFVMLIVLNVAVVLLAFFVTILNKFGTSSGFNSLMSSITPLVSAFIIAGFVVGIAIMVLYEKNR